MDEQITTDTAVDAVETHETMETVEPTVMAAVRKVNARRVKTERKPRARKTTDTPTPTAKAAAPAATLEEKTMNFDPANWMNSNAFAAMPGADRFQTLFADAGSRGQEAIEKSRKVAEELADLTRGNVEAFVEAGKIAATGAKTVGEEALQRTRDGLERNVAELKSLTEVTSPTEFLQRQGEIARGNFDRIVESFSQLAETGVKLAGEAMQPLSNRAAVNAEKLNQLTA